MDDLRPLDVFLLSRDSTLSKKIRAAADMAYSHAAVYFPEGRLFDALPEGVGFKMLPRFSLASGREHEFDLSEYSGVAVLRHPILAQLPDARKLELVQIAAKQCQSWTGLRYERYSEMVKFAGSAKAIRGRRWLAPALPFIAAVFDRAHSTTITMRSRARGPRIDEFLTNGFKAGRRFICSQLVAEIFDLIGIDCIPDTRVAGDLLPDHLQEPTSSYLTPVSGILRVISVGNHLDLQAGTEDIIADADRVLVSMFETSTEYEDYRRSSVASDSLYHIMRMPAATPEIKYRLRRIHAGISALIEECLRLRNLAANLSSLAENWPVDASQRIICSSWCRTVERKLQSGRPLRPVCERLVRLGMEMFSQPIKPHEQKLYRFYKRGINDCSTAHANALKCARLANGLRTRD